MSENPYQPPSSSVSHTESVLNFPGKRARELQSARGYLGGCIWGGFTLYAVIKGLMDEHSREASAWLLVDVALIFGLSFGIWRKSRICAVAILPYHLLSEYFVYEETGLHRLPFLLFMVYLFAQGIRGTFGYHSELRDMEIERKSRVIKE